MQLESYVAGKWQAGAGSGVALRDATTGEVIANATADGLDSGAMLEYAREVGGPSLRELTFHERAALLKALARDLSEHKAAFYPVPYATGATKGDSWIDIDGGISTLFVYAGKGTRELPNSRVYVDGGVEALSKSGTFVGQHVCVPLEGAAIHINAFNFPVWGMLEKLAPALLAGVPVIVKPASQTCYLAERAFRRIVESAILPEGAVQLICGGVGDLFEHLTCQDLVSFTGSAATALKLRQHPIVSANSVRFTAETDSLNSSVLGPDAGAGTPELELFVREVVREMTVKAGQKCTAIRKAIVPASRVAEVLEALRSALGRIIVGDPRLEKVRMGPVASLSQRRLVLGLAPFHGRIVVVNERCARESTGHGSPLPHLVHGGPGRAGGGEEMGGIRGVMHYLQRTAVQGTPDVVTAATGRWVKGARELDPGTHPFRKPFAQLAIGDTFNSAEREVTALDIERFADLSGDRFYAHMDEMQAARNPLFGGRVAHGYFLVSAAAGLFVDPPYGPVLANYGVDGLRFTKPVKPGDRIKVRLTCKEKTLRADKGFGEVRWDTEITNQNGEICASYDVL